MISLRTRCYSFVGGNWPMELTCLNCSAAFDVDETALGPEGGMVQCPVCHRGQMVIRRSPGPVPSGFTKPPPIPRPAAEKPAERPAAPKSEAERPAAAKPEPERPAAEAPGGSFRKPMQAFTGLRPRSSAAAAAPPTVSASVAEPARPAPDRQAVPVEEEFPAEARIPAGLATAVAAVGDAPSVWLVRSPTGLVLEFPASHLVVAWSAIIESPGQYQVSRGGSDWTGLDSFLREVKLGSKATQVFRRITGQPLLEAEIAAGQQLEAAPQVDGEPGAPSAEAKPEGAAPVEAEAPRKHRRPAPTAHFEFKFSNSAPPRWRRWVVAVAIGVAVAAVAAAVVHFSGLL